MVRWLSAACIAFGFAVVVNPDVAPFVLATLAISLMAVLLASSSGPFSVAMDETTAEHGVTDTWSSRSAMDQAREVSHLVLLSQPRR
ncbi:MAG TPA: hypothetical protein VIJ34_09405 [Acidimicrobiales bacterium]